MFDWSTLIGYLITPLTGLIGWLAGTRSRKNTAIQELLRTIQELSTQNAQYNESIVRLQYEVIEVRRENAELKAGQDEMTRQIIELKSENAELKSIITNSKPGHLN